MSGRLGQPSSFWGGSGRLVPFIYERAVTRERSLTLKRKGIEGGGFAEGGKRCHRLDSEPRTPRGCRYPRGLD